MSQNPYGNKQVPADEPDMPIGNMMKGMMKKKMGGKPFPPKKGPPPAPGNNQQDYVRG